MVTIKDVAARAGVSLITVSRVVNGSANVRPETRAKVQAAIEDLHYVPNQMASSLRSHHTRSIALLLPTIANSFWTTIARGAEDEAEARGYSLFLCNTDEESAKEARYIGALLRNRVDGMLIVPTPGTGTHLYPLIAQQMPFVQIHHKLDAIPSDVVRSDSFHGAAALTKDLVDAGCQRIAYLGVLQDFSTGRDRLAGFRDTLVEAGIEGDPTLIKTGTSRRETGYRLVNELLHSGTNFDALVIGNSRMAVGVLQALIEAGIRVPDDVAVAAYYDISALDDFSQFMTTVIQPAYEMGRLGAQRLFDRISGALVVTEDIILPNRVIPLARSALKTSPNIDALRLRLSFAGQT